MRTLIASVSNNQIIKKDEIRYGVLSSLMPHVRSVLGPDEAAKFDRVLVMSPE